MPIRWHAIVAGHTDREVPAVSATTAEKATLVGRIGLMMLGCGTGAFRVREAMNLVSRAIGITCTADIGLVNINVTIFDGAHHYTEALSLPSAGINTDRLNDLELFLDVFEKNAKCYSVEQFHKILDHIAEKPANYKPISLALAAALACGGFCFLLGGGLFEVICAFIGAGVGQFIRSVMARKKITLYAVIAVSVACACITYVLCIKALESLVGIPQAKEAGYICSMLFIIPGFPLITGGIDLAKQDMRSGLERLAYAIMMIIVATTTGMIAAYALHFHPVPFEPLHLHPVLYCLLRILASWCGVYGFSYLYNSPRKMALAAALFGMLSNTLRIELVEIFSLPVGVGAFIGALAVGLMAGLVERRTGYPRIALTVPSIVIMVPGMFMYQSLYFFGVGQPDAGLNAFAKAAVIAITLPLGLITARIIQDKNFRKSY